MIAGLLPAPWPDGFRMFSAQHAAIVIVFVLGVTAMCAVGRRLARTGREHLLARTWGLIIFANQAAEVTWYLMPENFDIDKSFPLQICDLAAWVAAIALFWEPRWARTMLYFWGLGLSTQAFITPTATIGPTSVRFWFFWLGHSHIVGASIYDIIVRGYRPTWRDFRVGEIVSLTYVGIIVAFNLITGLDYGFLGNAPTATPTLRDYLGPWPWRVIWIGVIVTVVFVVMTLPWVMKRPRGGVPVG